MNMKKKQTQILAIIVAAVILVAALVFHLVRINSDPLVSLSYLNNTVQPELEKEFSNQLDVKADELQKSFAAAVNNNNGSYKSVKIEKDQKVTFGSDSEFVFVSGNATASKANHCILWGSIYDDVLIAGSGDMDLYGSFGNDKLYGGSGKNDFEWSRNMGDDIVYNYTRGQDRIKLDYGRIDSYTVSGNDVILKSDLDYIVPVYKKLSKDFISYKSRENNTMTSLI